MIDVHSHILPGVDDGSKTVEMSIAMLKDSALHGVDTVISTSHCYLREERDIKEFLLKRNESYAVLKKAIDREHMFLPKIVLGAEVHIENDISGVKGLQELCIAGTDYILTELSYGKWHASVYDALYSMTLKGMRPVMAHIERFFDNEKEFGNLRDIELAYQINAESFYNPVYKKAIGYLLKNGMANVIGSDMHNTSVRVQNLKLGYKKIKKDYGKGCAEYFEGNARLLLNNSDMYCRVFKKLGFLKRHKT